MAHEFSFADVAAPRQHFCLTLPLRDYSIGHRLIFMRQRNPLVFGDEASFNSLPIETRIFWLIESVTICNQTYAHREQLEKSPTRPLLRQIERDASHWRKERSRAQKEFLKARPGTIGPAWTEKPTLTGYWLLAVSEFRNYLNASRIRTEFKAEVPGGRPPGPMLPCSPMPDAKGRSLGGPYEATLIQFLLSRRLCADEAATFEYPFALAEMHYLTHLEREGSIRIINAAEMQFEQDAADHDLQEARTAGFNTVDEHIAHVTAEEEKRKADARSQKSEPQKTGLATDIPDELLGGAMPDQAG